MRYNQLPTAMLRCSLVYLGIFQVCCLGARQRDLGGGLGGCSGSRGARAVTTLCRVRQRGSCEWTLFPTAEVRLSPQAQGREPMRPARTTAPRRGTAGQAARNKASFAGRVRRWLGKGREKS